MSKKEKAPPQAPAPPKMAIRYVAATGSPFSDEDAAIIGVELAKIAEENAVENIRSLDDKLIFSVVEEAGESHPLHQFYNWDDEEAARKYRVQFTGQMRRSVRIVYTELGERSRPMPQFLYDPDGSKRSADVTHRRKHVLTMDVLNNDPVFASALGGQIRMIINALEKLEHVTSLRPSPPEVVELAVSLRESLDAYFAALAKSRAA